MRIPAEGLKTIFCACRQLKSVDLLEGNVTIDDSVVICLAENNSRLSLLSLSNCSNLITDASFIKLADCCSQMRGIYLGAYASSSEAPLIRCITSWPSFEALSTPHATVGFTDAEVAAICKSCPLMTLMSPQLQMLPSI